MDWPAGAEPPAPSVLDEWLNRAAEERLVRRSGKGRKDDAYRYRLPNADDAYYDRGELPPLRGIPPLFGLPVLVPPKSRSGKNKLHSSERVY